MTGDTFVKWELVTNFYTSLRPVISVSNGNSDRTGKQKHLILKSITVQLSIEMAAPRERRAQWLEKFPPVEQTCHGDFFDSPGTFAAGFGLRTDTGHQPLFSGSVWFLSRNQRQQVTE